jgi:hypothetical protein
MTEYRQQVEVLRAFAFHHYRFPARLHLFLLFVVVIALAVPAAGLAATSRSRGMSRKPKGITHVVKPHQALFRISQAYGVKAGIVLEASRLRPSTLLKVWQRRFIPGRQGGPVRRVWAMGTD